MKRLLILGFVLLSVWQLSAQETTFILMRHSEKQQDGTKDPGLTDEGIARSLRLKDLLAEHEVHAIFSTPYQRTKLTVTPLSAAREVSIQIYEPFKEGFLEQLLAAYPDQTVVISGHSNTIPLLVNQLIGADEYEQLDDSDYNDLYLVTASELGDGNVIHLNY